MKRILGYAVAVVLSWTLLSTADAQMTGTGSNFTGTCDGMVAINGSPIVGTTQLSVAGVLIPASFVGGVFNQAECQCASRDISMHVVLTGHAGSGAPPPTMLWIGDPMCWNNSFPTRSTQCNKITNMNPPNNTNFSLPGSEFQFNGFFDIGIPAEVVANPMAMDEAGYAMCNTGGMQSYTATAEVGADTGPAYCQLPLAVNTQGPPTPPGDVSAIAGDGAVTLNWDVPAGTTGIDSYQVLCRKHSDPTTPPMSSDFLSNTKYYFSSCINKHLYRRTVGGLNINNDPATDTSVPIQADPFPVDPRLRCSDRIMANTTTLTARVDGLQNREPYDLMIVAIDPYGNPTASTVVSATPVPSAVPLQDYCDGNTCPGFGCQAGGRPPSSAAAGAGLGGLLALGLLARRRQKRVGRAA